MKLSAGTSQELPSPRFLLPALLLYVASFFEARHCSVRSPTPQKITQECRCSPDLPCLRLCSCLPRQWYCTSAVKWVQQRAVSINFCCVSLHTRVALLSWTEIPFTGVCPAKPTAGCLVPRAGYLSRLSGMDKYIKIGARCRSGSCWDNHIARVSAETSKWPWFASSHGQMKSLMKASTWPFACVTILPFQWVDTAPFKIQPACWWALWMRENLHFQCKMKMPESPFYQVLNKNKFIFSCL